MITMYRFNQIRTLAADGLNKSEIANKLGIDRSTVRKYLKSNAPPVYKQRSQPTRSNPLEKYESTIFEWLSGRSDISGTSLFLVLQKLGYNGSLRTIERRVEAFRKNKPKERFFEQEYEPGEQSQFDFKESVTIKFVNGEKVCHLLIATLPFSDVFFAKAFPNKTHEAFVDGMHSFFEYIGGLTEKIRF